MSSREGDQLVKDFAQIPAAVYPTGFYDLDRALDGGVRAGETTMIGGFTNHAKSAFAEQLALEISKHTETLYLAYELGEQLTRLRMGAKLARTALGSFRRSGLDPLTIAELNARRLTIFQPQKHTMEMLEAALKRAQHKVIFIDDCRNIEGVIIDRKSEWDAHRVAARIPQLAAQYGVHIFALQQLDPKTFRLGPTEWRYQDSTVFEQRAFNSLTIFRPYKHHGAAKDTVAEIRIRKSRWGPAAVAHYRWLGETMSFWEFDDAALSELHCCGTMRARNKVKKS